MIPFSGYVIGGLALTLVLVGGYAYIERLERQKQELIVEQERKANIENQNTIRLLRKSNEIFEEVAGDLRKKVEEITAKQEEEDAATTDLERSDEAVKRFLDTPVPRPLRCLWGEKSECVSTNGGPNP